MNRCSLHGNKKDNKLSTYEVGRLCGNIYQWSYSNRSNFIQLKKTFIICFAKRTSTKDIEESEQNEIDQITKTFEI